MPAFVGQLPYHGKNVAQRSRTVVRKGDNPAQGRVFHLLHYKSSCRPDCHFVYSATVMFFGKAHRYRTAGIENHMVAAHLLGFVNVPQCHITHVAVKCIYIGAVLAPYHKPFGVVVEGNFRSRSV